VNAFWCEKTLKALLTFKLEGERAERLKALAALLESFAYRGSESFRVGKLFGGFFRTTFVKPPCAGRGGGGIRIVWSLNTQV
jgi:hypothetical protein